MSSGKEAGVDERFFKDGSISQFVADAPFFDMGSPMTPYEWCGEAHCSSACVCAASMGRPPMHGGASSAWGAGYLDTPGAAPRAG